MLPLSRRYQFSVAGLLLVLMALTRGSHGYGLDQLPSASWAVFLLAGIYLRPAWMFPLLMLEAVMLDLIAVTWGGVSNFCISPAYPFLLAAYGSLWLAGRWYSRRHHSAVTTWIPLAASVIVGTAVCELFSSGSFYLLSGHFANTTLLEFGQRLADYYPHYLGSTALYVGLAIALHMSLTALGRIKTLPG